MSKEIQNDLIRDALIKGESITPQSAIRDFNCYRLAARIFDLKQQGMSIGKQMHYTPTTRYARYFLTSDK